jgi:hypothetical protein
VRLAKAIKRHPELELGVPSFNIEPDDDQLTTGAVDLQEPPRLHGGAVAIPSEIRRLRRECQAWRLKYRSAIAEILRLQGVESAYRELLAALEKSRSS